MSERRSPRRVPQVNLLRSPRRGFALVISRRTAEVALVALAALMWGTAGIGLALLMGWRPHLGLGP